MYAILYYNGGYHGAIANSDMFHFNVISDSAYSVMD